MQWDLKVFTFLNFDHIPLTLYCTHFFADHSEIVIYYNVASLHQQSVRLTIFLLYVKNNSTSIKID